MILRPGGECKACAGNAVRRFPLALPEGGPGMTWGACLKDDLYLYSATDNGLICDSLCNNQQNY